jgi:hypothetical protein
MIWFFGLLAFSFLTLAGGYPAALFVKSRYPEWWENNICARDPRDFEQSSPVYGIEIIKLTVLPVGSEAHIASAMVLEMPGQLKGNGHAPFVDGMDIILELAEPAREFIKQAKLSHHILVYQ